jgi:hypothetical protein
MLEYIQFYTKNLSNFAILLVIGVVIAILDIALRNVIRGVYLNVRENMKLRHGRSDGSEGMKNKADDDDDDDDDDEEKKKDSTCPKDCSAVEALRKKLTGLIENASKLQSDIQANNQTIKYQQKIIENMQKSVQKLVEKSNK